jgi:hypothetical protein
MRHGKRSDSDDDLNAVRGIGLALIAGFVLWLVATAAVVIATRSPLPDTEVASYRGVCSEHVYDGSAASDCD